ncbi:hypothetical protein [Microbispora triticiradicis]|uniref:hypothetical protein n=1 Tax=Microbispora triticiradicis TaxID=2200763 RepID=UPI001AD77300|nr:hypothetical protein [Microbispora triticiradicis]MBO4273764.1 hypothetical protein [Microbispora triticiradicis]
MTNLPETSLADITARVSKVREGLLSKVEKLLHDKYSDNPKYSDRHRDELIAELYVEARAELDRLAAEATQAAERITTWIDAQSAAPHVLHSELDAAWNTIEWQLNKGVTVETVTTHAVGAATKGDMSPLRALEARIETWARHGDHLPEGTLRDVVAKVRQAVADTTPGEAGMAARMRLQLEREQEDMTKALGRERDRVQRMESNERELGFALRRADVEANSVGKEVVRTLAPAMQPKPQPVDQGMTLALADDDLWP